jgi:hypothetical protein
VTLWLWHSIFFVLYQGSVCGAQFRLAKTSGIRWYETDASRAVPPTAHCDPQDIVHLCRSATLPNEDKIYPGSFVVYTQTGSDLQEIGRIREIIAQNNSKSLLGTLIEQYTLGDTISPYQLPALIPSRTFLFASVKVCIARSKLA